jgi:hypothetical protein
LGKSESGSDDGKVWVWVNLDGHPETRGWKRRISVEKGVGGDGRKMLVADGGAREGANYMAKLFLECDRWK